MDFYFERRASASALWARRTALFSAALLITARQGVALRERVGMKATLHGDLAAMYQDLSERIALIEEDRALDGELRALLDDIRAQRWELYVDA